MKKNLLRHCLIWSIFSSSFGCNLKSSHISVCRLVVILQTALAFGYTFFYSFFTPYYSFLHFITPFILFYHFATPLLLFHTSSYSIFTPFFPPFLVFCLLFLLLFHSSLLLLTSYSYLILFITLLTPFSLIFYSFW